MIATVGRSIRTAVRVFVAGLAVCALASSSLGQQSKPNSDAPPANQDKKAIPPEPTASKCDSACVRANMDRAAQACARPIEARAPIDFEWLTRPFTGIFQEADQPDASSTIVGYRGDSIRFLNPRKEWVRIVYECGYDSFAQKIVALRIRPGRLGAPAPVAAAQQTDSTLKPGMTATGGKPPQVKANLLAAAISEAVKNRQPRKSKSKISNFGEASPVEIDQINPQN